MNGKLGAWFLTLVGQAGGVPGLDAGNKTLQLAAWAIALVAVLWVLQRVSRRLRRRAPAAGAWNPELDEDLGAYGDAPKSTTEDVVTIYHLPARLRLVVAAPLGVATAALERGVLAKLVDIAVPGLARVIDGDDPRVKVWPAQVSGHGFVSAFFHHTHVPNADAESSGGTPAERSTKEEVVEEETGERRAGPLSRWILVAGRMQCGYEQIVVGLALQSETATGLGRVTVESAHQWLDILRVKPADSAG